MTKSSLFRLQTRYSTIVTGLCFALCSGRLHAQQMANDQNQLSPKPNYVVGGYVEALYQWNFNRPSNGITNFRGFDNRHNSFTLSNVALDAAWDEAALVGRLTLQVGHTPSTYYLAEPRLAGADGANATNIELWKYVQQAYVGYHFGDAVTASAGVFLSPIGPESMAVRDNWNWSRSNLFYGLPFYHTGVRLQYALSKAWAATAAIYNGWNSVVDNNSQKSLSLQLAYTQPKVILSLLYFGGVERAPAASEGSGWRHLVDAHLTWHVSPRVSAMVHANGGFERTRFGGSHWAAGAIYGRILLVDRLFLALRADAFRQDVAQNGEGRESPIFWPTAWVSSGTATIDYRPHDRASFRLEFRHDHAGGDIYFGSNVAGVGNVVPYVANRRSQDTLTLGATTWF
ncbi:MAG: outer membrane beta-barrel protein [Deltaproteobacteria bacterium]|nr:outer membrane beta-barrel protein [Deltaproteobacteria bacterium]